MKFTHRLHSLPSLGLFLFLAVGLFWGGSAQAALPDVGTVSTLQGQVANSSTSISFATFRAASTASDSDPMDTISYRINSVTTGTLTKGGSAVVAGTTTFATGETLVWTPPANQTGDLLAFTVHALAGGQDSTGTAQVTVRVPGPVFTNLSVISGGAEDATTVITYNELDSAGNATASSAISYRIESVISGTLTKNGLAVEPGATTIGNGEQLIWLPPANENGTLRAFTVRAMAAGIASATALEARITTSPVPDAPTISGTVLAAINDDAAATALFSSVVVADVDDGHPNSETVVLSVRVPQSAGEMGVFNFGDASLQNSGSDYLYTFPAKSPAAATAALAAVTFNPLPNLQPGGQTQGFTVVVSVKDSTNLSALSNLSGGTTITAIDDPPVLTLVANPSTILDFGTFHPFTLTVADPDPTDDVNKTLTLTLVEDAPARGTITGGTISGNSDQLATAIQSVTYQPFATEGSVTGHFHLTNGAGLNSPTADLIVSNQNDAPTISGITTALLHTTDDLSQPLLHPFATVTISDPDFASPGVRQTLTATITLDDPSRGSTNPATLTGTAAELTTLIRALTFSPTPNRVAVGSSETTALTLTVSDGALSSSNGQTRIATLSVNGAPSIQGVPLSQPVKFSPPTILQPVTPFAGLSVNDDDAVPQVTLKITLDNAAKGTLGNLGLFVPTAANSGIYHISTLSSISAVNSALQGLTFIPNPNFAFPPNQPGLTTFTLEVADVLQNRTTAILSIVLENRARNFLVSLREDNSLKRPGSLRHAVEQALDNDVITFALAEYPAVVRLDPTLGPLLLRHHLHFKGPGADLLSISGDFDGNGFPDGQTIRSGSEC